MTPKGCPVLSRRGPACFVPPVLAGDGREVKCWERVTEDQRWGDSTSAGSVGKVVKDGYCPALPHLLSAQLQLKAAAV